MGLREHKHGVSSAVWGHPSRTSGCVPPSTHGVFARAVRLALPPVLRDPRDGKPAPPAEPVCSPSCRTSVLFLADM
jgi:hypothetical protein